MFAEATFSSPVVDPECVVAAMAQTDAVSTASKRDAEEMEAEVVTRMPTDFHAMTDMAKFTVKQRKEAKGKVSFAVKYDGLQPFVDLTPGEDTWISMPFGVRLKFKQAEHWEAIFCLESAAMEWVTALEKKLEGEVRPLFPDRAWHSSLYNDLLSADVTLGDDGREAFATQMMVKLPGKDPVTGCTKEFLQPILDKNFELKHAKAKVVLKLVKIWISEKNIGVQWRVDIVVMKTQPAVKTVVPSGWGNMFKK
jgi:hypothetical protein